VIVTIPQLARAYNIETEQPRLNRTKLGYCLSDFCIFFAEIPNSNTLSLTTPSWIVLCFTNPTHVSVSVGLQLKGHTICMLQMVKGHTILVFAVLPP